MHVVVATVVHHPLDARIRQRQIGALLAAGHQVTYLAPFAATSTPVPPELDVVDVPRASGRNRSAALRVARERLRGLTGADVILIHDLELILALPPRRSTRAVLVWDVHEDVPASITMKSYLPRAVRPGVAGLAGLAERVARRRLHLLLAEETYVRRLGAWPVVPNLPDVPDRHVRPGSKRCVYVGSLTFARGLREMIDTGRRLQRHGMRVHLVGEPGDPAARTAVEAAHQRGHVVWHGRLPNPEALALLEGACCGLSLLHDQPNYRHSLPTKVAEYLSRGVPVVTTPLPRAVSLVERSDGGVVVPFEDADSVVEAALELAHDHARREQMGAEAWGFARRELDWSLHGQGFVRTLEHWSAQATGRQPARAPLGVVPGRENP